MKRTQWVLLLICYWRPLVLHIKWRKRRKSLGSACKTQITKGPLWLRKKLCKISFQLQKFDTSKASSNVFLMMRCRACKTHFLRARIIDKRIFPPPTLLPAMCQLWWFIMFSVFPWLKLILATSVSCCPFLLSSTVRKYIHQNKWRNVKLPTFFELCLSNKITPEWLKICL